MDKSNHQGINNRAMNRNDTHWIATVLMEDPVLVQNREKLYGALNLPPSNLPDIRMDVNINNTGTYGFFTLVLNQWISREGQSATLEALLTVLFNEGFKSIAESLIARQPTSTKTEQPNNISSSLTQTKSIFFDIPEKISHFTGRIKELEHLHRCIANQTEGNITVITTLSGLGGIGKTTLAIHYAWTYSISFYSSIIWINSENMMTFQDSCNRLADLLDIDTGNRLDLKKTMNMIYQRFCQENTLFVFDNVEKYESSENYLPKAMPNQKTPVVLITSRNCVWMDKVNVLELNVFSEQESVDFFINYLNLEDDGDIGLAKEISKLLQNLPLAIRQAGAYIKIQVRNLKDSNSNQMKEYIRLFNSNSKFLLGFEYFRQTGDKYKLTALTTWKITMAKIKKENPVSAIIMKYISYLHPDNIPIKLFEHMKILKSKLSRALDRFKYVPLNTRCIESAIQLLTSYSMIARNPPGEVVNVHRLVQSVIRLQIERKKSEEILQEVCKMIKIVLASDQFNEFENSCLVHAETILEYIKISNGDDIELHRLINTKQDTSVRQQIKIIRNLFQDSKWREGVTRNKEFMTSSSKYSEEKFMDYLNLYASMVVSTVLFFLNANQLKEVLTMVESLYLFIEEEYTKFPAIVYCINLEETVLNVLKINGGNNLRYQIIVQILKILRVSNACMREDYRNHTLFDFIDKLINSYLTIDKVPPPENVINSSPLEPPSSIKSYENGYIYFEYEKSICFPLVHILTDKQMLQEALCILDIIHEWSKLRNNAKHMGRSLCLSIECSAKLKCDELLRNKIKDFKKFVENNESILFGVDELFLVLEKVKNEIFLERHWNVQNLNPSENELVTDVIALCKIFYEFEHTSLSTMSKILEFQNEMKNLGVEYDNDNYCGVLNQQKRPGYTQLQ